MKKIDLLLLQIEAAIPHFKKTRLEVSSSNVGWHIEHSLLVLSNIVNSLASSDPKKYNNTFSLKRLIVFTLGKIPRGKGKSPQSVKPKAAYGAESLAKNLSQTRAKLKELNTMPNGKYFKHPIFGDLKKNQTIKFLEIHTSHHLHIINDILN